MTDTPWAPAPKKQSTFLKGLWKLANLYTLMFVGLKVAGLIAWSWWGVFAPVLLVFGITFAVGFILALIEYGDRRG